MRKAKARLRRWPARLLQPLFAAIYAQLARRFQGLVDALNEVSDMSYRYSDKDILRLYEIWMKTGSRRAHGLLRGLGVEPVVTPGVLLAH